MDRNLDLIDLDNLTCFMRVAETGSLATTAAVIGIPQRLLIRNIRRLEQQLDAKLLLRFGRGIALTELGKKLFASGKDILRKVHELHREIGEVSRQPREATVLGMPPTASRILCVPVAKRYLQALPTCDLKIVESFSGYIRESLSTGEFDVAVLYSASDIVAEPLWVEDLFLIGPPTTSNDSMSECPLRDLKNFRLILPGRPHGLRLLLDECASRHRLKIEVTLETDSLPTIIELVAQGAGYTVLPLAGIGDLVAARELSAVRLTDPGISRSLVMATSTQKPVSQSARVLLDVIRDEARHFRTGSPLSAIRAVG